MRDFELIRRAMTFAERKHEGQKDDSGDDYYHAHVFPVMEAVSSITGNSEVIAAAILHDTVEDTDTTYAELVREFGKYVANLVMEVSREGTNDNYGYYFPRLKTANAILIKLCDRASNIGRMESWDEKRKAQYLKRTKFWKDGSDRK